MTAPATPRVTVTVLDPELGTLASLLYISILYHGPSLWCVLVTHLGSVL